MLELENIKKSYKKKGQEYKVIENLTCNFPNNGIVLITGRSGIGKTTLLNLIGGLDNLKEGKIKWNNQDISSMKELEKTKYRNLEIGMVPQDYALFENLSVLENINLVSNQKEKIDKLLEELEIAHLKKKRVKELSGGEAQRVAIIRAIIKEPKIILCDEITSNIDKETSKKILELLKKVSQKSLVIIVSHDVELVKEYADILYNMENKTMEIIHEKKDIEEIPSNRIYEMSISQKILFAKQHLFANKKKLIFSILLLSISIVFSIISYNIQKLDSPSRHSTSLIHSNKSTIYLNNEIKNWNLKEIESLRSELKNENIYVGKSYQTKQSDETFNEILFFPFTIDINANDITAYYKNLVLRPYFFDVKNKPFLDSDIIGKMPSASNEILIYQYLADLFINNGVYKAEEIVKCQNYQELLNLESINLGEFQVKIAGIIKQDLKPYESLKNLDSSLMYNNKTFNLFQGDIINDCGNIYVTKEFESLIQEKYEVFDYKVFLVENNKKNLENILKKYPIVNSSITSSTAFSYSINTILEKMTLLGKIFKGIAKVLIFLTLIILMNYLETSIDKHRREIGTLKMLGIQSIPHIYLLESLILASITIITSFLISIGICLNFNNKINQFLLFEFSPFQVSWGLILLILIITYTSCLLITYLLLWKIKKINPIQIIKK